MLEKTIETWPDFAKFAQQLYTEDRAPEGYIYRGVPIPNEELKPSLRRLMDDIDCDETRDQEIQNKVTEVFKSQMGLYINPDATEKESNVWNWSLMQHHGAPTPLLDWTFSIYAALYFAVREKFQHPGMIWICHVQTLIKNLGSSPTGGFNGRSFDGMRLINQGNIKELEILANNNIFARAGVQQGCFTLAQPWARDHREIINAAFHREKSIDGQSLKWARLTIPKKAKHGFLEWLHRANITGHSLFPGLDGLGCSVRELGAFHITENE